MPNLVKKIGIRGWTGRTPSLSLLLVLPFVLCILRTASFSAKEVPFGGLDDEK